MVGSRVAAVIRTEGWTTHTVDARKLVPVPNGI
jgi:hypothetical protein